MSCLVKLKTGMKTSNNCMHAPTELFLCNKLPQQPSLWCFQVQWLFCAVLEARHCPSREDSQQAALQVCLQSGDRAGSWFSKYHYTFTHWGQSCIACWYLKYLGGFIWLNLFGEMEKEGYNNLHFMNVLYTECTKGMGGSEIKPE